MTKTRSSVIGQGPELFGRGIDLLFGEADENAHLQQVAAGARSGRSQETTMKHHRSNTQAADGIDGAGESPDLDPRRHGQAGELDAPMEDRSELDLPVEPLPLEPTPLEAGSVTPAEPLPLELGGPASPAVVLEAGGGVHPANPSPTVSQPGASQETPMPQQPRPSAISETSANTGASSDGRRKVAPPGVDVSGPGGANGKKQEFELSGGLSRQQLEALTPDDVLEILSRLRKSDLASLDKEVDALYDKVSSLLSGNRREATVAFEILRKVRLMLLKDPEQFAQAEYLLRQVRARVNQIEQSIEAGARNAPRIFAFQVIWVMVLAAFALVTTVGGTTFSAGVAQLLGVEPDSERLNWAVLFLSTLAWGGIGGVTSALWSLYYHISIQRDYDPIENLWYYSQPVLGMILGGIVFLIMGGGFLIVQVDLSGADAALGARLLPAAVAVIVGFRQTVVLDLIERAIALITPARGEEESTLVTPPAEPI